MKRIAWTLLPLLALLTACPKRQTQPAAALDTEAVRQHAEQDHQDLDRQQP